MFKKIKESIEKCVLDISAAHKRINFLTERIMQLEHYIGLRSHEFQKRNLEQKYFFRQIHKDISNNKKPETIIPFRHKSH